MNDVKNVTLVYSSAFSNIHSIALATFSRANYRLRLRISEGFSRNADIVANIFLSMI